jgi:hypothetical protein
MESKVSDKPKSPGGKGAGLGEEERKKKRTKLAQVPPTRCGVYWELAAAVIGLRRHTSDASMYRDGRTGDERMRRRRAAAAARTLALLADAHERASVTVH